MSTLRLDRMDRDIIPLELDTRQMDECDMDKFSSLDSSENAVALS